MDRADLKEFQEIQKSLGRRICDLRRQKGWSQEQLAHESGLGRASMGTIERGACVCGACAVDWVGEPTGGRGSLASAGSPGDRRDDQGGIVSSAHPQVWTAVSAPRPLGSINRF